MADLGDYLTSINSTKENIMRTRPDDPKAVSGYSPFIVNRLLSYHRDCILIVNEINCIPDLDEQLQYEFLLHALTKKKRFSKLYKAPSKENLDIIQKFYGYSVSKAMEVMSLHRSEDLEVMRRHLDEGGVIKT